MSDYTTISVSTDFRNAIHSHKNPGESYEDILREYVPAELLNTDN